MQRSTRHVIPAQRTTDGAGIRILRNTGPSGFGSLDPFLMLDELKASSAEEVAGGFPPHPHRGFETLTLMLEGELEHRDHLGNRGHIGPGGVQWMTAGRGIVHSEMPVSAEDGMHGFQFWLNLPARDKMQEPRWRDVAAGEIPLQDFAVGVQVRVIAGELAVGGSVSRGPVESGATEAVLWDVRVEPGAVGELPVSPGHSLYAYVYRGALTEPGVQPGHLAAFGEEGDRVRLVAGDTGAGLLLFGGRPLREPVAHYGPFVMNTQEEIEQALRDYRDGRLAPGHH